MARPDPRHRPRECSHGTPQPRERFPIQPLASTTRSPAQTASKPGGFAKRSPAQMAPVIDSSSMASRFTARSGSMVQGSASTKGCSAGRRLMSSHLLRDENVLIVKLDPAPQGPPWFAPTANTGWKKTVVFNNVYGWHYCHIPGAGDLAQRANRIDAGGEIAQSVRRDTRCAGGGCERACRSARRAGAVASDVEGNHSPENFDGDAHRILDRRFVRDGTAPAASAIPDSRCAAVVAERFGRAASVPAHAVDRNPIAAPQPSACAR